MKHLPSPISYREDINGLRAWAVIAVLLFHFKLPGVSAGFIGVDVFFVISGFLMTAIIVKGLEGQNFSIWQFYMARIRRIAPALMVLVAVLLVLGWFWLPTPDYQSLGTQSAYSLAFLSNIHYWQSSGYFDAAAQEKWLLHTWSLGIEAQFYVLFPIYLMILWKIKPHIKTLFWGLSFAFAASLAVSIGVSHLKPGAAFYLLPTRGWELAAGGLAFLIGREVLALQRFAKPMFWLGIGLWLSAVFLLDSSYAWPSGWGLLPVLGAVFIILANQSQAKLMVNPIAQWVGRRSYSLYLWHWPFMVALYFVGLQNDWLWIAAAIVLSFVLAHLSYQLVEVPTRTYLRTAGWRKEVVTVGLAGLVIGLTAVSVRLVIFDNRLPPAVEVVAAEKNNRYEKVGQCIGVTDKTSQPVDCYFNNAKLGVISVGDSHNNSVFTGLGTAAEKFNLNAMHWARSACPTLKDAKFYKRAPGCYEFNEAVFFRLTHELENIPVILVSRLTRALIGGNEDDIKRLGIPHVYFNEGDFDGFSSVFQKQFKESLIKTSCMLAETRPVYLIRPIPEMGVNVPDTLVKNIMFRRSDIDVKIILKEYHQRHDFVWEAQDQAAEQCGVKILDPLPYLCDDQYCYGSKNGRPLYYDDDHLSEYGNKFLVPMFEQVFRDQQ